MIKRGPVAVYKRVVTTLGLTLFLQIGSCLAQSPAPSAGEGTIDGAMLYRNYGCSACHGDAGAAPLPEHPRLAGQDAAYLIAQLRDFKREARTNGQSASMRGYLKTVSDEELIAIAQYLSKQPCR